MQGGEGERRSAIDKTLDGMRPLLVAAASLLEATAEALAAAAALSHEGGREAPGSRKREVVDES